MFNNYIHLKILIFRRKLLHLLPEWIWPRVITLDGVRIPLRDMPWSFGTKTILRQGTYEAEERALLAGIVTSGMQVIEMGSSIGILTAIIAEKIGPTGRLVAVEASEKLTRHSVPFLARYPWVTVLTGYAFPVWRAPHLHIKDFNEDRGNLGGVVSFQHAKTETVGLPPSNIFDLATLCLQFHLQPTLLVADVEGSEQILLTVAPDFPASLAYILMEIHPGLFPKHMDDARAIIDVLNKGGFKVMKELRGVYLFGKS